MEKRVTPEHSKKVYLFGTCLMDAVYPDAGMAAIRLLEAQGFRVGILAQPDWAWHERGTNTDRTALHRFAVSSDGNRTPYQGSGFVPGVVNDQFSIDERAGIIEYRKDA